MNPMSNNIFGIGYIFAPIFWGIWDLFSVEAEERLIGCLVICKLGTEIERCSSVEDLAEISFALELIKRGQRLAFCILKEEHDAWDIATDTMFEIVGHKIMKTSSESNQRSLESKINDRTSIREDFFRRLERDYLKRVKKGANRQLAKRQQIDIMIISLEELERESQLT